MSWAQLIGIRDEARQIAKEDREHQPVDCPLCGTVMDDARGVLHCPFDGYTVRKK